MKLFSRKKAGLSNKQVQAAEQIADRILRAQRRAADYLNYKTSGISPKSWLLLLVGFCMLFGSYCLYLLAQVFN